MEQVGSNMEGLIYLDNAATTRVKEAVLQAMLPYFRENFSNPAAMYGSAQEAKQAVEHARNQAAALIGARPEEIYFTSGGSEADNWALKATAEAYQHKGKHIITSKIEHYAILHTCRYLEEKGFAITYLDVDAEGKVSLDALREAIREDTILISIMAANNEIGTIEPIGEIGKLAHERGILFHTDAVQAYGHIELDVDALHIDLLSVSGHKLGGPKGIGLLYIRNGLGLGAFIHGGAQERSRRAGTHNTAGIVGLGKAVELAGQNMQAASVSVTRLRNHLIARVLAEIPYTRLNGHGEDRLPGNANFSFQFVEGESVLILLDQLGICASGGSACTSGSAELSHVLLALGLPPEVAKGSLRISLSEENTLEEIDYVVEALKKIIRRLRSISSSL